MEICRHLFAIYDENVMMVHMVRKWCKQFKTRWESIYNKHCGGCSIEVYTDKNRNRIEKLISSDHRITVTKLEAVTGLASCQIYQFIHKLGSGKVSARWVPKIFIEDHLTKEFLMLYHHNSSIIQQIMIGDT